MHLPTRPARPGRPGRPGRLSGRTALLTGASRGIGRAIALRFAEEGADLFLTATGAERLQETRALAEARGAQVWLHPADVSRRGEVEAMVGAASAALGTIDVLVNNAGRDRRRRMARQQPRSDAAPSDAAGRRTTKGRRMPIHPSVRQPPVR